MLTSGAEASFKAMPVYKYQGCPGDQKKKDWVRQILVEHRLFFASRRCFNDPFDCVVPPFVQIPATILKRFVSDVCERRFPNAGEAEKREMIARGMSLICLEDTRKDFQNEVDEAGIVCLSKIRDDILMWAHYGDKHRGLCFEFDGSDNCAFFGEAQPVVYDDYTSMPLDQDNATKIGRVILTKSKHWDYEQEYRIIRPRKAGSSLDYPVELLTGIIFGYMMPENIRELVKQWTVEGHCSVAFFEARPKAAEFGLDIVRID